MASRRKAGLPEGHELKVDIGGLTDPAADIPDFLDLETMPAAPKVQPPKALKPAQAAPPAPRRPKALPAKAPVMSVTRPDDGAAAEDSPQRASGRSRLRARPPRKEVGFDDETLAMLKDLHHAGASQSMEEGLTRSEVARAALRAIHAARNLVDYSRIGPRGKWGTATARALQDDLTEAYIRAVGKLYVERYHSADGARAAEEQQ